MIFSKYLFSFLGYVWIACIISSCDVPRYISLDVENKNTNIIDVPADTNNVRIEFTYNNVAKMCVIYMEIPNDYIVNEDSLIVKFSNPNYMVDKIKMDKLDVGQKGVSKISPSHRILFHILCERNHPKLMYLNMTGVIIKDGKSLINDTIIVSIPQGIP